MKHEDSARNCWAPEITYDKKKKQYMIYWATTIAGKYAAFATPIRAFAEATCRSAKAISGRRSNSSEGRATGMCGGSTLSISNKRIVTSAGAFPMRIAIACSS